MKGSFAHLFVLKAAAEFVLFCESVHRHVLTVASLALVASILVGAHGDAHSSILFGAPPTSICTTNVSKQSLDVFGQQMDLLTALAASNSSAKLIVVLIHGQSANHK